jgi:mannosyltransferase OCH1-like enzyme
MISFIRNNVNKSIPKLFHYVWVGGKQLPKKYISYIKSWTKYNPDFQIIKWDENNIDFSVPYIKNAYKNKNWSNISNYIRLWSVSNYGGIYLDTDVEIIQSFADIIKNNCFMGFCIEEKYPDWVNNATFGAIKKHWFTKEALKLLLLRYDGREASNLSGPSITTELLIKNGLKEYSDEGVLVKDIMVYPIDYFNPFNWNQEYSKAYITDRTHAIHYWDKSWWTKEDYDRQKK